MNKIYEAMREHYCLPSNSKEKDKCLMTYRERKLNEILIPENMSMQGNPYVLSLTGVVSHESHSPAAKESAGAYT
jgi:hypothetical protein